MTQAQAEAYECGLVPEHSDARFVSQHLAAYAFARRFVRGKRVLEVGFGEGFGANDLAEVAEEVVGVDIAPGNIPRAQAKYPRANLRFMLTTGTTLDFPDASFDVVGSFQVIEHIPEAQLLDYLTEIRRVLTPEGLCVISTLNLEHNRKPGQPYQKLCYHEKEFTAPELRALLERVFPHVELHGLYLSPAHHVAQRLKKWGLMRWGPPALNPIARFYDRMTVGGFHTRPGVSRAALDLIAVCRKT
jgi:2-polyprenyl-3-methyl-5-hydroxy-6-metoxy-1,4-benzoquinol methylase